MKNESPPTANPGDSSAPGRMILEHPRATPGRKSQPLVPNVTGRSPVGFNTVGLVPNVKCNGQLGAVFETTVQTRKVQGARLTWTARFYLADGTPLPAAVPDDTPGSSRSWNTTFYLSDNAPRSHATQPTGRDSTQFVIPTVSLVPVRLFFPFADFAPGCGVHPCFAELTVEHQAVPLATCTIPFRYQSFSETKIAAPRRSPATGPAKSASVVSTEGRKRTRLSKLQVQATTTVMSAKFSLGIEGFRGQQVSIETEILDPDRLATLTGFGGTRNRLSCPFEICWWPELTRKLSVPQSLTRATRVRVLVRVVDSRQNTISERISEIFTIPAPQQKVPNFGRGTQPVSRDQTQDPYHILGVARGCSRSQLRQAYLARVRGWHPDRVEGMPPALQEIATEGMKLINWAKECVEQDVSLADK